MELDKIGGMSQGDLRRFIVNLLHSDPGALPKPRPAVATPAGPGTELAYDEFTSGVTISATTEGTSQVIVTADSVAFDGQPAVVSFFAADASAIAAWTLSLVLWDDTAGVSLGILGVTTMAAGANSGPLYAERRLTPDPGDRIYSIRGYRATNNGTVQAGAGGAAARVPGFIKITKA